MPGDEILVEVSDGVVLGDEVADGLPSLLEVFPGESFVRLSLED